MSNGRIPCLHADPVLPDCPPGESVSVEGRIYLLTGDLNDLKARYERDFNYSKRWEHCGRRQN